MQFPFENKVHELAPEVFGNKCVKLEGFNRGLVLQQSFYRTTNECEYTVDLGHGKSLNIIV
jgi:hypothetical protein